MTTSRTARAAVLTIVALLAAAGCSSSHHTTPTGTGPASSVSASSLAASASPATSAAASSEAGGSPSSAGPSPTSSVAPTSPAVSLAGFRPASVTFASATHGFVLGVQTCTGAACGQGCVSGSCATLVTTVDAGKTWSNVGAVPAALTNAVTKVRFATASDGWAFGPQLWSTHDGGHTWSNTSMPGPVSDVEASGGVAYALVASCGTPPCIQGDRLLKTPVSTDGWTAISGPALPDGAGSISPHGSVVWVVVNGGGSSTFDMISGGNSWHRLANPCASAGTDLSLVGVAPVSTSSLFLLCAGNPGAGSEDKVVLFSTDGGAHATVTSAAPSRGGIATGIAAASTAVVAVPAASGASYVYRSADGGHTWGTPLTQGDGGVGYFDVGFTTATQGVAVYGNPAVGTAATSLLITRDAGATWKPVTF